MSRKEPTRAQLSSKLAYNAGSTPAFIQRLKNRVAGTTNDEDDEFDEWEASGRSGRPPIPRRPSPPQRPDDDPGSADEDGDDEAPQIVVLKEGKHLTERQAEDERRRARGLSPLPDGPQETDDIDLSRPDGKSTDKNNKANSKANSKAPSLSFSSTPRGDAAGKSKKRKVGAVQDDLDGLVDKEKDQFSQKKAAGKEKKTKKAKTGALLSFGDDG